MTLAGVPKPQLAKEARALMPIWLGAGAAIVAANALGILTVSLMAFVLGASALGAYSTGHEYAHRTLPSLLAQPARRERILYAKLLVLAPFVIVLAIVCWVAVLDTSQSARVFRGNAVALVVLTPLLAIGVAPWLAVACRSTLAGLVFTLSIPAALLIAGEIARSLTVGFQTPSLEYGPGLSIMVIGIVSAAIVVSGLGRWWFIRQEVVGDHAAAIGVTRSRVVPRRRSHPMVLLAKKEVRLHTLALAVAALFACGWIALRMLRADQQIAAQSFETIIGLYSGFMAILVGAIASAEERALDVTASQALIPYPFWKQWGVKVAITAAIAVVLGPGLAAVLEAVFPLIGDTWRDPFVASLSFRGLRLGMFGALTVVITLLALHISTLCTSGVKALLMTLTYILVLAWAYARVWRASFSVTAQFLYPQGTNMWWRNLPTAHPSDFAWSAAVAQWLGILAVAGLVLLALIFGFRNHRSAERRGLLARRQLLWIALYVPAATFLAHTIPSVLWWYLVRH